MHPKTLLLLLLLPASALAQSFSLAELLHLSSASSDRFLHTAVKKGYRTNSQDKFRISVSHPSDTIADRFLVREESNRYSFFQLQKQTPEEYKGFKQALFAAGFQAGVPTGKTKTELFFRREITITATTEIDLDEEKRWYNVYIERRNLPRPKSIQFAEDLLAFDAHHQLQLSFGGGNLAKDTYLDTDDVEYACSVLFAGTSREAVFVWNDAQNFRQLRLISIGATTRITGGLRHNNPVAQNEWVSRQGVYATMTLNQLQNRNGASLRFLGWGGGASGELMPGHSGALDFSQIGLHFSCLNCNDDQYTGGQILQSERAIADGRRIFISTLIFRADTPAANK